MKQHNRQYAILVIDDDDKIRHVVKRQLASAHYTVFEAGTADQAIDIFGSDDIDAVVCDIKMKDTDGFELTRRLKKLSPALPVIILTGFIEEEYSDRARELDCFDFLVKPVKREKLIWVVDRAVKKVKC